MINRSLSLWVVFALLLGLVPATAWAQRAQSSDWLGVAIQKALKVPGVLSVQGMTRGSSHFMLVRTRESRPCAKAKDLWQEIKVKADIGLAGGEECWRIRKTPFNLPEPNKSLLNFTLESDPAYYDGVVACALGVQGLAAAEVWGLTPASPQADQVLAIARTAGMQCHEGNGDPASPDYGGYLKQLEELKDCIEDDDQIPASVKVYCRPRCCYGIPFGPLFKPIHPMPPFVFAHLHEVRDF